MTSNPYCCPVCLALDQQHLLGEAVRGVRLLRVAAPQVFLVERHGRELRVGADGADLDELGDAGQTGLLHQLDAHDRVLVEEATRVLAIGADAADDGGEVDDDVRPAVGQGPVDAVGRPQVVVAAARDEDVGDAGGAQAANDRSAEEPGPAGDHDPAAGQRRHPATGLISRSGSSPASRRSASTISRTSAWNVVRGRQPSTRSAFDALPHSSSTSVGRK